MVLSLHYRHETIMSVLNEATDLSHKAFSVENEIRFASSTLSSKPRHQIASLTLDFWFI